MRQCYAGAMCFQCYGPLSCLLLVMSSQEVPLVSSHLISSHLVSFDSLLFHGAQIYTQCLGTLSFPASSHVEVIRPLLHSTEPWVI